MIKKLLIFIICIFCMQSCADVTQTRYRSRYAKQNLVTNRNNGSHNHPAVTKSTRDRFFN